MKLGGIINKQSTVKSRAYHTGNTKKSRHPLGQQIVSWL